MKHRIEFHNNESLKAECRRIVESEEFKILVNEAASKLGSFSRTGSFNEKSHIQDRIDGGKEAIVMFISNLFTLPYKEADQEESDMKFLTPFEVAQSSLI